MVVESIATVALAAIVIAGLMQIAYGGVYLVLGNDAADKRNGARRLAMGGLLVLLFVLLFSLPACGPIDGNSVTLPAAASTVEPVRLTIFDHPVDLEDLHLKETRGADALHWASCREGGPQDLCTEPPKP